MQAPLVSVVMTVYNAQDFLAASIESVLAQTHANLQFIIVDDGSTDRSADIIRGFSDSRIEYYPLERNCHIAYATNFGFSKVRGDYVAIMDSDDIWLSQKLERQLAYLAAHPEHTGCFTWVELIDGEGNCIDEKLPALKELFSSHTDTREDWLRFFFFHGNRLNNPSALFRAEALPAVGPHSLFYIQATDMEWWVRFTKKFSFGILEEPLIRYRRILDSETNISSYSETHDTRFYNEHMHIRLHFFDDMDDGLFLRTFQPFFRFPGARTPEELACEKAFLLCQPIGHSSSYCAFGILKLEELLDDPAACETLRTRYQFSTPECGQYTGAHVFNDPALQRYPERIRDLEGWIQFSQLHIEKQDTQIASLEQAGKETEARCRSLEQQLARREAELQAQEKVLADREEQLRELTDTLDTIVQSTAWKATAPLRALKDRFTKNR